MKTKIAKNIYGFESLVFLILLFMTVITFFYNPLIRFVAWGSIIFIFINVLLIIYSLAKKASIGDKIFFTINVILVGLSIFVFLVIFRLPITLYLILSMVISLYLIGVFINMYKYWKE